MIHILGGLASQFFTLPYCPLEEHLPHFIIIPVNLNTSFFFLLLLRIRFLQVEVYPHYRTAYDYKNVTTFSFNLVCLTITYPFGILVSQRWDYLVTYLGIIPGNVNFVYISPSLTCHKILHRFLILRIGSGAKQICFLQLLHPFQLQRQQTLLLPSHL